MSIQDKLNIAIKSLTLISECTGKTLLGEFCTTDKDLDREHQVGANKAFEECAGIAAEALKDIERSQD